MARHLGRLGPPTAPMPTDRALAAELAALYRETGAWTWFDDYEWPGMEVFYPLLPAAAAPPPARGTPMTVVPAPAARPPLPRRPRPGDPPDPPDPALRRRLIVPPPASNALNFHDFSTGEDRRCAPLHPHRPVEDRVELDPALSRREPRRALRRRPRPRPLHNARQRQEPAAASGDRGEGLAAVMAELAASPGENLVISSEHLSSILVDEAAATALRDAARPHFRPVIVVFLRRQDYWHESNYAQDVKNCYAGSIEAFTAVALADGAEFDYDGGLARLERVFGRDNLRVLIYHDRGPNDVVTDFLAALDSASTQAGPSTPAG